MADVGQSPRAVSPVSNEGAAAGNTAGRDFDVAPREGRDLDVAPRSSRDFNVAPRGTLASEAWRRSRGSAHVLRYVSLLYTGFFFIEPFYRQSRSYWLWFAAFYVAFVATFFAATSTRGRMQRLWIGVLFVLAFGYYPFNVSASGAFVYPIVLLAFCMRSTRIYLAVMSLQLAGIAAETWFFHLPWWAGGMGIFFSVVIGLSNLSYSHQQRANFLLRRANDEIEHLAKVAERERIARDLHDLLGHTLTVIAMKAELAQRILDRNPRAAAQEMLDVEQTARKALNEVREAVTGYRSEGLGPELLRARRTLDAAGVALDADVGKVEVSPGAATVLGLCLREAVTNIVRHAQATACTLLLTRTDGDLHMTITDNGIGLQRGEGNGLSGMRERVEAPGGRMRIASEPGRGTRLQISLPATIAVSAAEQSRRDEVHA